jgi:hypothetical protein
VAQRDLFLSVLTIGELRRGAEARRSSDAIAASALAAWIERVVAAFDARILGVDAAVADAWGRLSVQRSVPVVDCLLAATALTYGLILVTRNIRDVRGLGVELLNPFGTP